MFKRRERRSIFRFFYEVIFSLKGISRAIEYVGIRLKRIPDTPHKISLGMSCGIFASFTPLFGLHFLIAGLLSYLLRANVLASLIGTAFTDLMIVLTGVMQSWPQVVEAPFSKASEILSFTAGKLLTPFSLVSIAIAALLIIWIANWMTKQSQCNPDSCDAWLLGSAALTTTLWVDGLFFVTTLIQPQLSGLI